MKIPIICVTGVAGTGKSTIGELLATELHCCFLDADTLHSARSIERMNRGIPLSDFDQAPWLAAIHARIVHSFHRQEGLVVACSALKQIYRQTISNGLPVIWVYLKGSEDLIRARLLHRRHHFMEHSILPSQFADLEEPAGAIVIDAAVEPPAAVRQILAGIAAAGTKYLKKGTRGSNRESLMADGMSSV